MTKTVRTPRSDHPAVRLNRRRPLVTLTPVRDRCGTDPARTECEDPPVVSAVRRVSLRGAKVVWGLRAEGALSTMRS